MGGEVVLLLFIDFGCVARGSLVPTQNLITHNKTHHNHQQSSQSQRRTLIFNNHNHSTIVGVHHASYGNGTFLGRFLIVVKIF
jgi:hypothetical protein